MKKYFSIGIALAIAAGVALISIPASAQQGIPGYSSDGAVVAISGDRQQHQVHAKSVSVLPKHEQQPKSDIPGYAPDGAVVDIK
jgi:hypothetical protein